MIGTGTPCPNDPSFACPWRPDSECPGVANPSHCGGARRYVERAPSQAPGLLKMAGSLAKAVVREVAHVAKGGAATVTPEVLAERTATCEACPHYDRGNSRCLKCGCYAMKRTLPAETCPDNPPRWGPVT